MRPQLVSNLTQDENIGIAVLFEPTEDTGLEFCHYYGRKQQCEEYGSYLNDSSGGMCSTDGNLWGSNDMGSPLFCTRHTFPMEQLGYEFVDMKLINGLVPVQQ